MRKAGKPVHIFIRNAKEMGFLGNAFGSFFLDPLVYPEAGQSSSVLVSTLGPTHSGKSTFIKASCSFLKEHEGEAFNWPVIERRPIPSFTKTGDKLFRHVDLGLHTYPLLINSSRLSSMGKSFLDVKARQEEPGIDFLEHPSLPHLVDSTVAVIFGDVGNIKKNSLYLEALAETIQEVVKRSTSFGYYVNPVVSTTLETLKNAQNLASRMRCNEESRLVSILPLQKRGTAGTAFDDFKKKLPIKRCSGGVLTLCD